MNLKKSVVACALAAAALFTAAGALAIRAEAVLA